MVEYLIIKCPYCESEFYTNNINIAPSNYYTCGKCGLCFPLAHNARSIKRKDLVIWLEENKVVEWCPQRTPALGWSTLTILEALADSSRTCLSSGNLGRSKINLNKILKILRNKIERSKKDFRPLIQRCEFMENKRTRCNRTPVIGKKNGKNYCKIHFNKIIENNDTILNYLEKGGLDKY